MKILNIKKYNYRIITIVIAFTFLYIVVSCNSDSPINFLEKKETVKENNVNQLLETEKISGLTLPSDSRLIFSEKGERNAEKYFRQLIHTPSPINFCNKKAIDIPIDGSIKVIKKIVPRIFLGKPQDKYAHVYEWSNQNGNWRMTLVHLETGYYLEIERFNIK